MYEGAGFIFKGVGWCYCDKVDWVLERKDFLVRLWVVLIMSLDFSNRDREGYCFLVGIGGC